MVQRHFFRLGGRVRILFFSRRCLTSVPHGQGPHGRHAVTMANAYPSSSSVRPSRTTEPRGASPSAVSSSYVLAGGASDPTRSLSSWTTSARWYSDVHCATEQSSLWCDEKDDEENKLENERNADDTSAATSFEWEELRQWASTLDAAPIEDVQRECRPPGPFCRHSSWEPSNRGEEGEASDAEGAKEALSRPPHTASLAASLAGGFPSSSPRKSSPMPIPWTCMESTHVHVERENVSAVHTMTYVPHCTTTTSRTTSPYPLPSIPSCVASSPIPASSSSSSSLVCSLPKPACSPRASHPLFPLLRTPTKTPTPETPPTEGKARRTRLRRCARAFGSSPQAPHETDRSSDVSAASPLRAVEEDKEVHACLPSSLPPRSGVRTVTRVVAKQKVATDGGETEETASSSPASSSLASTSTSSGNAADGDDCSHSLPVSSIAASVFSIPAPDVLLCTPRWKKKDTHPRLSEASPQYFPTAIAYYHRLHAGVGCMAPSVRPYTNAFQAGGEGGGGGGLSSDSIPRPCLPASGKEFTLSQVVSSKEWRPPKEEEERKEEVYAVLLSVVYGVLAPMHSDALMVLLEYATTAPTSSGWFHRPQERREKKASHDTAAAPAVPERTEIVLPVDLPGIRFGEASSPKWLSSVLLPDCGESNTTCPPAHSSSAEEPTAMGWGPRDVPHDAGRPCSVADGGPFSVYASSSISSTVFLVILEAVLLRLCDRAMELTSKQVMFLTAMGPSLVHGVLSRWEEREEEQCATVAACPVEEVANGGSDPEVSRLAYPTGGASSLSPATRPRLSRLVFPPMAVSPSPFHTPVSTHAPSSSSSSSTLRALYARLIDELSCSSSSSSRVATYFFSTDSHSRRVGRLLQHTLGWCGYVNRESLRRVQNVHCLHAFLVAHLLPPPFALPLSSLTEENAIHNPHDGVHERQHDSSFLQDWNNKTPHPNRSEKRRRRSHAPLDDEERRLLSRATEGHARPPRAPTCVDGCPVAHAASPLSHALSHAVMRCITSKEGDSFSETISANDITYLPQFALTHAWGLLFPIVRSAALLWVQKHKVRPKGASSSPSSSVGTSLSSSSPGTPLFLSALPRFLDSVRPSQPPREVFSRLTRVVQDSQHFSLPEWDRAYVRWVIAMRPLASSEAHPVGPSHDLRVRPKADTRDGNDGSGKDTDGIPIGMVVYHGIRPCPTHIKGSSHPVHAPSSSPSSSSSSFSFSSFSHAQTEERVRKAVDHLLSCRGEDYLWQLSFLQEKVLPLHPFPSIFSTLVRDHPSLPLATVLVHHMLYREWPRVVSAQRHSFLGEEEEEDEEEEANTMQDVVQAVRVPLSSSSSSSSLAGGSPVASFSSPLTVSPSIPQCTSPAQRLVRGLWLLLRRVNVLEATRDILWILPTLCREDDAKDERKKVPVACPADLPHASPSSSFFPIVGEAKEENVWHGLSRTEEGPHPLGRGPSPFFIPVEVMAVLRCVAAHIPPSLVRVVVQQVVDRRDMAALPLHPFVLHFLVLLLRAHKGRKIASVESCVEGRRRSGSSECASRSVEEEDHHHHDDDDRTPQKKKEVESKERHAQRPSVTSEALPREATVSHASPSRKGRKDIPQHSMRDGGKQRSLSTSAHTGTSPVAGVAQEDSMRDLQEVIHKLAKESLAHNAYYARRTSAGAANGDGTSQKEKKEENLDGWKEPHQWWWQSAAYDTLWQQVEQEAVPPSSFFLALPSTTTTAIGEWSFAEEEEAMETDDGLLFSDALWQESPSSFADPLHGPVANDTIDGKPHLSSSLPLFSPPSSVWESGTANAMSPVVPHTIRTAFPLSSCKVTETDVPNDHEKEKNGSNGLWEGATPIPPVKEIALCSRSSLEGMMESDRWRYWHTISHLVHHPEVDMRLCSAMATMQRKFLLLLHRRQRSKVWLMEHD